MTEDAEGVPDHVEEARVDHVEEARVDHVEEARADHEEEAGAEHEETESERKERMASSQDEAPLSDIVARIDGSREPTGERPTNEGADDTGLFEREDVVEIDGVQVLQQLGTGDRTDEPTDARNVHDVPKRQYCHRCEHFTEPPDVGCSNPGTTILALVSMDTFRVADCPVVAEEASLEAETVSK